MAEETTETEPTQTDIFQQQKKTIDTLVDVLAKEGVSRPQQVVYSTPAAPAAKPTNYILYAGIAVVIIFLLKKR